MPDSNAPRPFIQLVDISKSYDRAPLLQDISFGIERGEVMCLLGPSGTGKTTLLRILAGLEQPEAGRVLLEGRDLTAVPPHRRGFGLMFQDLALFPHRSVGENVGFGLKMQGLRPDEIRVRVNETLALAGLDPERFARRDVNRLSGGEQQRVALARSLAPRPRFLMFDEPMGSLDRILREQLVADLRALLKQIGMTALYVTHDQEEAFAIADCLVILNDGRVEQIGRPQELYDHPASAFVARFLGLTNLVPVHTVEQEGDRLVVGTALGAFVFPGTPPAGGAGYLLLRPTAAQRIGAASSREENVIHGRVIEPLLRGGHISLVIAAGEHAVTFESSAAISAGTEVMIEIDPAGVQFVKK